MTASLTPRDLIDQLVHNLNQMAKRGWCGFDCSPDNLTIVRGWGEAQKVLPTEDTLSKIRKDLGQCQRCGLYQSRTHIVFGSGNSSADLVFVGDHIEDEDDQKGKPFIGPAGQLLTRIIAAMKLNRDDVYLCNIVKCRPPNNRSPLKSEIDACSPFLARQISTISPKVICTMGRLATQVILNSDQPFTRLRGRFHDLNRIKVMPTFHPAELLRHPEKKRETWADIQKIMRELNLPVG
ncbi:MAG: uracil-DNA glycosylase [Desulfobacteraceae bacterium]|jgi:DNA polymerase